MAVERGSAFLLKVGDGAATPAFATVAGLRTTQLSVNGEAVVVTTKDSGGWRQLLSGAGVRSVSVSGAGLSPLPSRMTGTSRSSVSSPRVLKPHDPTSPTSSSRLAVPTRLKRRSYRAAPDKATAPSAATVTPSSRCCRRTRPVASMLSPGMPLWMVETQTGSSAGVRVAGEVTGVKCWRR